MRTDPRAACANAEERLGWAVVHDAIAHPLMALTNYSGWAVAFHDWTSHRAWPRKPDFRETHVITAHTDDCGLCAAWNDVVPGIFCIKHGKRDLLVRLQARDAEDAMHKGLHQFRLQAEHEAAR